MTSRIKERVRARWHRHASAEPPARFPGYAQHQWSASHLSSIHAFFATCSSPTLMSYPFATDAAPESGHRLPMPLTYFVRQLLPAENPTAYTLCRSLAFRSTCCTTCRTGRLFSIHLAIHRQGNGQIFRRAHHIHHSCGARNTVLNAAATHLVHVLHVTVHWPDTLAVMPQTCGDQCCILLQSAEAADDVLLCSSHDINV
jgi:hypothetical protein